MTLQALLLISGAAVVAIGIAAATVPRGLRLGLAVQAFGVAMIGIDGGLVVVGGSAVGSGFKNGLGPAM